MTLETLHTTRMRTGNATGSMYRPGSIPSGGIWYALRDIPKRMPKPLWPKWKRKIKGQRRRAFSMRNNDGDREEFLLPYVREA